MDLSATVKSTSDNSLSSSLAVPPYAFRSSLSLNYPPPSHPPHPPVTRQGSGLPTIASPSLSASLPGLPAGLHQSPSQLSSVSGQPVNISPYALSPGNRPGKSVVGRSVAVSAREGGSGGGKRTSSPMLPRRSGRSPMRRATSPYAVLASSSVAAAAVAVMSGAGSPSQGTSDGGRGGGMRTPDGAGGPGRSSEGAQACWQWGVAELSLSCCSGVSHSRWESMIRT